MKPELSLYLDVVRFFAALVVFVSHFALHRLSGGFLWQLNPYGYEAVTVFFVLSGFVIAYATSTRERDAATYAISRAARIYSVAVPALLLTVVLDAIGSRLQPELYSAGWGYVPDHTLWRFFAGLSFCNELWALNVVQGSNAAYWSMGYEVPYYVIFGLALYAPARWRVAAVALALLVAGPAIVLLLPIWLMGVAAYRYTQRHVLSVQRGRQLFFGSLAVWLLYEVAVLHWGRPDLPVNAVFKRHQVLQDYVIGICFTANIVGFNAAAPALGAMLLRHATAIRWVAGATFTLYLCHFSIAQFLLACMPWPAEDARSRVLVFSGTLLAVFALAAVTERRKRLWRGWFEDMHGAVFKRPSSTS